MLPVEATVRVSLVVRIKALSSKYRLAIDAPAPAEVRGRGGSTAAWLLKR